ncbi:MAG TPA: glycosyltransferase family 4 protein [Terriglobales bacterium]|nr:glycosyltransferase family 4 protein [Terriglobales bacterium]
MKIAVWHNLPSGGGKRALYDQVRGLLARGHSIEVWCPPTADLSYLSLRDMVPEHVVPLEPSFEWWTRPAGLKMLYRLRWNPWAKLRAMGRHSRECAQQINAKKFDLLFAASCILYHTPSIGRFLDIPSVLYLQEPNRPLYEAQPELPWSALTWTSKDLLRIRFWQRALLHRVRLSGIRVLAREERRSALAFDQILVNSFFSRESVLRTLGVNSQVCYLGVDTDKFINQEKKREFFVVFVGALIPSKNVEFLIESLGKVPVSSRPKLVLISNTIARPYLDLILELAEHTGVVLELKHRISDTEVIDTLNRARIMLYAPRLEPFGYAVLEASACGLPVIAVAEGGVRETIQDGVNGILVDHDPESMAAAIERMMHDEELHSRLSAQAQNLAKTTWSLNPSIERLERRLRIQLDKRHLESWGDDMREYSVPASG